MYGQVELWFYSKNTIFAVKCRGLIDHLLLNCLNYHFTAAFSPISLVGNKNEVGLISSVWKPLKSFPHGENALFFSITTCVAVSNFSHK